MNQLFSAPNNSNLSKMKLNFKNVKLPMYKREIEHELLELAKGYPVITVIGPRQSGKTTLI